MTKRKPSRYSDDPGEVPAPEAREAREAVPLTATIGSHVCVLRATLEEIRDTCDMASSQQVPEFLDPFVALQTIRNLVVPYINAE